MIKNIFVQRVIKQEVDIRYREGAMTNDYFSRKDMREEKAGGDLSIETNEKGKLDNCRCCYDVGGTWY